MIALLKNEQYFVIGTDNICEFLLEYVKYIGGIDTKIFEILIDSNKMSIKELVEYINNNTYSWEENIVEIYKIGEKIY